MRALDMRDGAAVRRLLVDVRPHVVFLTGGFGSADACEAHPEQAESVNVTGVRQVAEATAAEGAALVYFSSDHLTANNRSAPYIPELCASGYQAPTDDADVGYDVTGFYAPEHERGVRYDDPAEAVQWPVPPCDISAKDVAWPLLPRIG